MIVFLSFFVGCRFVTGDKSIHKAAYKGDLSKVKEILERDPSQVNARNNSGVTPLYLAALMGNVEIVNFLLAHNAYIEAENSLGERPLAKAAKFGNSKGNYDTLKTLLEHGAIVNCKDMFGQTPLHEAALQSGKNVINILVSYGADVAAKDEHNNTPLHEAAKTGNIDAAEALVENGADIFEKNNFDFASLRLAAAKGDDEAERKLLVIEFFENDYNKTPKEIALERGHKELAGYLQIKEQEKRPESMKDLE